MTKPSRHHNKKKEFQKKKGSKSQIDQNKLITSLTDFPITDLDSTDIIIVNTDDKLAPQAGDSMISTRTNRMIASLGNKAETVSIFVQAFNRLEKTKICVECILKYSTEYDYELVLVDNGSTDGTLDYFKSIKHPQKKIVRVTNNIGGHIYNVLNNFSGRYLAYIPGDVYVTKNWLTNLLTCMKSEETIGIVVPVASNISLQGSDITFSTLDEMQMKAAKHNISNPSLWHERLTLFPTAALYKREALDLAGATDAGFFYYLSDNDFSFRVRRAGYKTVLCKDTFVHHDHNRNNPSERDPEEAKRSLEAGRRDFRNKYFGIDAWEDVNNFELTMISLVNPQELQGCTGLEILGVDVLCGTPILEIKNKLREAKVFDARLSAFSTDPKYWLDLKTICAGQVVVDRIDFINDYFGDQQFDFVFLGKPINTYEGQFKLLQGLLKCLKINGHLLLKLRNTFDIVSFFKILGATILNENTENAYKVSLEEFLGLVKKTGNIHKNIAIENWPLEEINLKFLKNSIATAAFSQKLDEVFTRAVARDYFIDIVKIQA